MNARRREAASTAGACVVALCLVVLPLPRVVRDAIGWLIGVWLAYQVVRWSVRAWRGRPELSRAWLAGWLRPTALAVGMAIVLIAGVRAL
jgi:hypothetical protein